MYLTSSQYLDEWNRLQETLSYEAVRQGKHSDILDDVAKGVLRVDDAFLRDMEIWRADLAEHLHKQARFIDRTLNQRELNHLVLFERTIDRIVFLRIAEDGNLESYGSLERAASVRRNVYNKIKPSSTATPTSDTIRLVPLRRRRQTRPNPDTLSMVIYIVDNVLRKIIRDLYPPKSAINSRSSPPTSSGKSTNASGQSHRSPQRRRKYNSGGRRKTRSAQSRRRLLHAQLYRRLHRQNTVGKLHRRGDAPAMLPRTCAYS